MFICTDPKNFGNKEDCKNCPAFFNVPINKNNRKEALKELYDKARSKISVFKNEFGTSPNIFYLGENEIRELLELRGHIRSFYGRHIIKVKRNDWFEAGHTTNYVDPGSSNNLESFALFYMSPN